MDRVEQMRFYKKRIEYLQKRIKDYGDAFAKFGIIGVLWELKIAQRSLSITRMVLHWLMMKKRDTLIDYNYAAMGIMLIDE